MQLSTSQSEVLFFVLIFISQYSYYFYFYFEVETGFHMNYHCEYG